MLISIVRGLIIILGVFYLMIPPTSYAREESRCRKFIFFKFACRTVQVEYSLEKSMRRSGEKQFHTTLDPVFDNEEITLHLELTNKGDVTEPNLKIKDTLPANLEFVSSDSLQVDGQELSANVGDSLKPHTTQVFVYVVKANTNGIKPGEKRCVTNFAVVYRDENQDNQAQETEQEDQSEATLCILNQTRSTEAVSITQSSSTPETASQLPESAVGNLGILPSALVSLGLGFYLQRKITFRKV